MLKLSIIIPAYNEEKRISRTLDNYVKFFNPAYKKNYEILVVLNGCVDNTLEIVKRYSKQYEQVTYLDYKDKIGKGGAIINGFKHAKGSLIGFVDADMATKPYSFNKLILALGNSDGVIASRYLPSSVVAVKQSISRRIASRGFNMIVRTLFGLKFYDTQLGAKLFTRRAIKDILPHLGITNFSFDIDLLYHLRKKGYKIKEVPTIWENQEGSTLRMGAVVPNMFLSVFRLRLIYSRLRFIVRFYDMIHDTFVK